MKYVYLNSGAVPEAEAVVSVFDHGFLYGDGVYETMRSYNGRVFMMREHLSRLRRSASLISLNTGKTDKEMSDAVHETMKANGLKNAYIRLSISRGKGPIGLDPALCPSPTFVIIAEEFKPYPEDFYKNGVSAMIANTRRNYKGALDPKIKSLNFLNNILAKIEAKQKAAFEAIMLNFEGRVAEGTISNVCWGKGDALYTPSVDCGILDGITRHVVIDLARGMGIDVREGGYGPSELLEADEVFITNTTMQVMPVGKLDDKTFAVGPMTKSLMAAYDKMLAQQGFV